jgi:CubicO group peptidase (beta-lactamase class C family)
MSFMEFPDEYAGDLSATAQPCQGLYVNRYGRRMTRWLIGFLLFALPLVVRAAPAGHGFDGHAIQAEAVDHIARETLAKGAIPGLAMAIIDDGQVAYVGTYGLRDAAQNLPLEPDTDMYAASLTKAAFGYMVAQLADEHVIDLDAPISRYLKKPLPDYPHYKALAGDDRWRALTPRLLLGHSSGFANFPFLEPDQTLRFHFAPGERYAYSGEGINLLQFVLEEGLGLDLTAEMQRRVFDRFGMSRSSLTWRDDFAANVTTGYGADGKPQPHTHRGSARAAGSMDTTITDYAHFLAGFVRGDGLSAAGQAQIRKRIVPITSLTQFPTLDQPATDRYATIHLAAALGWVTFDGPYGQVLTKGGHDDQTDNLAVCVAKRCLLMMTNSGVGERLFPTLTRQIMGDPGMPWAWEYNPLLALEP